jgi:hypothetical protein
MFMRVNSKCAHQVRPPPPAGSRGTRLLGNPCDFSRPSASAVQSYCQKLPRAWLMPKGRPSVGHADGGMTQPNV